MQNNKKLLVDDGYDVADAELPMAHHCRVCEAELNNDNWYQSNQKNWNYICKECTRKYKEDNKESIAAVSKIYREENKESAIDKAKVYRENNKEDIAAKYKVYCEENKESIAYMRKDYNRLHPPEFRTYVTPAGQCIQLNNWFDGCRRHHADPNTIIHIPKDMHVFNRYNIKTGKGMSTINAMAFEYLFSERTAASEVCGWCI